MKRVTLLYPHTHDGTPHATGVTLPVPDHVADWLLDRRIATLARTQGATRNLAAPVTVPADSNPPQPQTADTAKPEIDHDPAG